MVFSLSRIWGLFWPTPNAAIIARLHDVLVAGARDPVLYQSCGVADTFEGRFEMLALHSAIFLRALKAHEQPGPDMAQDLADLIFHKLELDLREAGIGDVVVPKRMGKLVEGFLGRTSAYDAALRLEDAEARRAAFVTALTRNVPFNAEGNELSTPDSLAAHALALQDRLDKVSLNDWKSGYMRVL